MLLLCPLLLPPPPHALYLDSVDRSLSVAPGPGRKPSEEISLLALCSRWLWLFCESEQFKQMPPRAWSASPPSDLMSSWKDPRLNMNTVLRSQRSSLVSCDLVGSVHGLCLQGWSSRALWGSILSILMVAKVPSLRAPFCECVPLPSRVKGENK